MIAKQAYHSLNQASAWLDYAILHDGTDEQIEKAQKLVRQRVQTWCRLIQAEEDKRLGTLVA